MYYWIYDTPLGIITITANDNAVTGITFGALAAGEKRETQIIKKARSQLSEYLDGKRKSFDVPMEAKGTQFQKKVWEALCAVAYGSTKSYKEIAAAVGNVKACRAVGMANNKNPIPIFIPCHRVIGADGSLIGYGAGLDVKEQLLALESKNTR